MASPFKFIRRNQKILLAASCILAIGAFVFLDPTILGGLGGGGQRNPVMVTTRTYGNLTARDLDVYLFQRRIVLQFFTRVGMQSAPFLNPDFVTQGLEGIFGPPTEQSVADGWLLAQRGKELGWVISDEVVNAFIQEIGSNKVRREELRKITNELGDSRGGHVSQRLLFDAIKHELLAQKVRESFRISLAGVTPAQRWAYYRRLNERATVELVPLSVSKYTDQVEVPDDAVLEEYFARYRERLRTPDSAEPGFRQPHRVVVQYLKAEIDKVLAPASVTEQEIRDYYEKNKELYVKTPLPGLTSEAPGEPSVTPPVEPSPPAEATPAPGEPAPAATEPAPTEPAPAEAMPADQPGTEATPAESAPQTPSADPPSMESPAPTETPPAESPASESVPETPASEPAPEMPAPEIPATDAPAEGAAPAEQPDGELPPPPSESTPPDQSSADRHSPFRLTAYQAETPTASEPAPAADTPATETPTAPAADTPAAQPATAETPATEPTTAGPAIPSPTAAEAGLGPSALPSLTSPPPKEYQPLEEVQDQIRLQLARQKAGEAIRKALEPVQKEMSEYHRNWINSQAKKTTAPKPLDLKKLAQQAGATLHETGLISAFDLDRFDIGSSQVEGGYTFGDFAFQRLVNYRPALAQDLETGDVYLFWKTQDEPEHEAEFGDEGIRQEVIRQYRMERAVERAEAEAKRIVAEAEKAGGSLQQAVADEKGLQVITTAPFSWMTSGPAMMFGPAPPRISAVEGVEMPGEEFMKAVFGLKKGELGAAFNQPKSMVYVIRLVETYPPEGSLWELFLIDDYSRYQSVGAIDRRDREERWLETLKAECGFEWKEKPTPVQTEEQAE